MLGLNRREVDAERSLLGVVALRVGYLPARVGLFFLSQDGVWFQDAGVFFLLT